MIDATVGGSDANSFIDVDGADSYFSTSLVSERWDTNNQREASLIEASACVSSLDYRGEKNASSQALAFPRDGGSDIPAPIIAATAKLALYLFENPDSLSGIADLTTRIAVGSLSISQQVSSGNIMELLPIDVRHLLTPYLSAGATLGGSEATGGAINLMLQ